MNGRILGLDALRGIAALIILFYHVTATSDPRDLLQLGYLSVDLFFMLSGFVMARTYEHRLREGWPAHKFMLARFRRLWPIFAIGCVLGLVAMLSWTSPGVALAAFLLALLFLPSPFDLGSAWPVNGPGWSLFYELAANIAHALVFAKVRTGWLLAVLAAGVAVLAYTTMAYGKFLGPEFANFPQTAARAVVGYLLGIVIFRIVGDKPEIRLRGGIFVFPIVLMLGAYMQQGLFAVMFVILICPLLILSALRAEFGPVGSLLASWSGKLSYPLYAVHAPLIALLDPYGAAVGVAGSLVVAGLLAVLAEAGWFRNSRSKLRPA